MVERWQRDCNDSSGDSEMMSNCRRGGCKTALSRIECTRLMD